MKAIGFLLGSALFLAGCSQAINYTYSKKNFTSPTFEADLSACKHHKSPVTSYQGVPRGQQPPLDDATVRGCMKEKGYNIEMETK
jgi:PBP1b-binding outer membrane lipoprotein LpoB